MSKSNQSNAWKQNLNFRNMGKQFIKRHFKNGRETNLWFDTWYNHQSFINTVGWNNLIILENTVLQSQKLSITKNGNHGYIQLPIHIKM